MHKKMAHWHGNGLGPEHSQSRIGHQVMDHVEDTGHMSEHLGHIPDVTGRRRR